MDKITRRSFLKGTLAGTAAVAAMGLGGVSALAEQPTYTPAPTRPERRATPITSRWS